jgi:guanyl-specific ribonuclease Sa
MPNPLNVTTNSVTHADEVHALRKAGVLGNGANTNHLFAMSYHSLPREAHDTIRLILNGGPFPFPVHDGSTFQNRFGDLPGGEYREYTVRTPGIGTRGARRIVARKKTGQLFYTACHYDRVSVTGGTPQQRKLAQEQATAALDAEHRNGFYIVTGMTLELRNRIVAALA